jgi:hypothetical protein
MALYCRIIFCTARCPQATAATFVRFRYFIMQAEKAYRRHQQERRLIATRKLLNSAENENGKRFWIFINESHLNSTTLIFQRPCLSLEKYANLTKEILYLQVCSTIWRLKLSTKGYIGLEIGNYQIPCMP